MRFWLAWIVATLTGFLLSLFFVEVGDIPDVTIVRGTIGGGIVGLFQGLVLLRRVDRLREWIIVNAIAAGLMVRLNLGAIGWVAPRSEFLFVRLVYGLIFGAIAGLLSGMMQGFVLRNNLGFTPLWAILNSLVWGLSLALGWTIGGWLRLLTQLYLGEAIGLGITWMCSSAMMGLVLGYWLNKRETGGNLSNR